MPQNRVSDTITHATLNATIGALIFLFLLNLAWIIYNLLIFMKVQFIADFRIKIKTIMEF